MIAAMNAPPALPDRAVLDDLYRRHYRALVRLASLLVDDVGRCEELVQEAFVQTMLHLDKLRDPARADAYLRSAVLNGARSDLRRQATARRHLRVVRDDGPGADAGALRHDDQAAVLAALRQLPDRQRDVLVLRYWLDLGEADIARALGISAGTVKTHVKRGLDHLATTLEGRR
jgi:RNA polymerase sigma-70 factor (sigma-E family)